MNFYCPLSSRRMLADSRFEACRRLGFTQAYVLGPVCGMTACYSLTCQKSVEHVTKRSAQKYGVCGKHARFTNFVAWTDKRAPWVRRRQFCRPDATSYSVHFDIYLDGSPLGAHGVTSDAKRQGEIEPAPWPQDTLKEHSVPEIEVCAPTCGQARI
jgi:hypothetical protein